MPPEATGWLDFIAELGLPLAMLVAALYGGARGIWLWRHHHEEMMAQKELQIAALSDETRRWRELALSLADSTTEAVTLIQARSVDREAPDGADRTGNGPEPPPSPKTS